MVNHRALISPHQVLQIITKQPQNTHLSRMLIDGHQNILKIINKILNSMLENKEKSLKKIYYSTFVSFRQIRSRTCKM